MGNIFNPQEILKIAVNVDTNGKKLYQSLEDRAGNEKLKATWKYLKEQEETHRQIFQEMLDKIGEYIVHEFSPGEYEAYLRAIASEYIFTQKMIESKINQGFSSDLEAVDFGIQIEKESILTYSALKEYILTARQGVLEKVIDEERRHLANLVFLKDQI